MRGIVNIIIGAVFIIGGMTGGMTLRGTSSSGGLIAVGVLLVGIGLFPVWRGIDESSIE